MDLIISALAFCLRLMTWDPLTLRSFLEMPTKTATAPAAAAAHAKKIQELENQIADLQAQLDNGSELSQTLWLNDRFDSDRTRSGKRRVRFSAQKSTVSDDGARAYGAYKNFVAYGELAEHIIRIIQSTENLVHITAFESPWSDNSKRSDWVVKSLTVIPRLDDRPAPDLSEQPAPFAGEPTDEEVPF